MRRLLGFLMLLLLPAGAAAQQVDGAVSGAIRTVIEGQLQAFQSDDGNAAFSFAAPIIQEKFGDPGTFMDMVRTGYGAVYRPREVEFRGAELKGESVLQQVLFVDQEGKAWLARYTMQRMSDGSWKIAGVWLEALPDVST